MVTAVRDIPIPKQCIHAGDFPCAQCTANRRHNEAATGKKLTDQQFEYWYTNRNDLPSRILKMCEARGWSLHWTARGAYLHLEASELIEALRGKRGDPASEAADVLIVLMSITENANISWPEVLAKAHETVTRLEKSSRYKGEEYTIGPDSHGATK